MCEFAIPAHSLNEETTDGRELKSKKPDQQDFLPESNKTVLLEQDSPQSRHSDMGAGEKAKKPKPREVGDQVSKSTPEVCPSETLRRLDNTLYCTDLY